MAQTNVQGIAGGVPVAVTVSGGGSGTATGAGVTDASTTRVVAASDSPDVSALGATGDAANTTGTTGTISGKLRGLVQLAASILAKLPALGTAGTSSADVISVQGVASGTALPASLVPATSGGLSIYRSLDVQNTGAVVKAGAGQLYGYYLYNNAAAVRYVKVYDKATAATQADTPLMTLPLPAGAAANVSHPNGIAFASGISIRASQLLADADTTAPTAGDVVADLYYK